MMKKRANNPIVKKKESGGFEDFMEVLMIISGVGLIFSFFTNPQTLSAQSIQLAPPMPNYMVYAFGSVLIMGIIYFMAKRVFKKKSRIPLSFH